MCRDFFRGLEAAVELVEGEAGLCGALLLVPWPPFLENFKKHSLSVVFVDFGFYFIPLH